MKIGDLLAYSMQDLGDGWVRNEIIEREELLCYNSLITLPLNLNLSIYDKYRGRLNLELRSKKEKRYFVFYDEDTIDLFFEDLEINNFKELKSLENKRNLEGIFDGENLLWISAYNKRVGYGKYVEDIKDNLTFFKKFKEELKILKEENLHKPPRLQSLEVNFIKESDRIQKLSSEICNGLLRNYSLEKLIKSRKDIEDSIDKGIKFLGECAEICGKDSYSTPNFCKYLGFANSIMTALEIEIEAKIE